jgi:uncharacterized protein YkwD
MLKIASAGLLALCLCGCAMSLPSLTSPFAAREDDEPAAQPKPVKRETAAKAGIWETFSAPFRSADAVEPAAAMADRFKPEDMVKALNAYRVSRGLKPLRMHPKLEAAAKAHAADLAKHDRISHFGSDGSDIEERARRAGYDYTLLAENIGAGQRDGEEALKGWTNSPSHNSNLLLADARDVGVALVYNPQSKFKTFWTMVVGAAE